MKANQKKKLQDRVKGAIVDEEEDVASRLLFDVLPGGWSPPSGRTGWRRGCRCGATSIVRSFVRPTLHTDIRTLARTHAR